MVAAVLTWVLPAGEYERRDDAASGRTVVIPGTYAAVEPAPVGPWQALVAVPRGMVAGIEVILTILFVGGAFALLDATGALPRLLGALLGRTRRPRLLVVALSIGFALCGAAEGMHEEIIALVPVLVVLSRGLGFGAITAVAMSMGSAMVGATFGQTNPFGTGIALRMAELPPMSEAPLRLALFAAALAVWVTWTLSQASKDDIRPDIDAAVVAPPLWRDHVSLWILLLAILAYVWGVLSQDWGMNELTALFLAGGLAVGLLQGRSIGVTTSEFIRGMESMLGAGLLVGVARAISVVLTDGRVIDTMIAGLVGPLSQMPPAVAGILMIPAHAAIHVPVASYSGQAVLTMPIMAPLADLIGLSRDAAVLAYQAGAIMFDAVNPANGAMFAMLLKGDIPYARWLRFAVPGIVMVWVVAAIGILILG